MSLTTLWDFHDISQLLADGNFGYGDYAPRWMTHYEKSMQVFPTKLICNPPATIAFWDDGTKTVAKTSESRYDPYVGLLCCIVKHVGASALDDGESVNGKLNRILVDAGMRYQAPSKFGKHWFTKEFQRFTVTTPNGKCKEKWIEVAGTES